MRHKTAIRAIWIPELCVMRMARGKDQIPQRLGFPKEKKVKDVHPELSVSLAPSLPSAAPTSSLLPTDFGALASVP